MPTEGFAANEVDIRCFCKGNPLLAKGGRGADGNGYVHVKSYKRGEVRCEVVVTSGTAHIHCPNCLRWHRITIRREQVQVKQEKLPETISV